MSTEKPETDPLEIIKTRPFFLSILCTAIAVYTFVLSIAFLITLIYNEWVIKTLNDYFDDKTLPNNIVFWSSVIGLTLNIISFYGILKIWRLKITGYYLYSASSLLFVMFPFIIGFGNIFSVSIIIAIIAILSLFVKILD